MPHHPPVYQKFLLLFLLSLSFSVILSACSTNAETAEDTSVIDTSLLVQEISASGEVAPIQWVTLSYPNGASDLEVMVAEGDRVKRNEILITSNDNLLRSTYFQARAALERAQLNYNQIKTAPSESAIETANAAYLNALANLNRQKNLGANKATIEAAEADVDAAYANLKATLDGASDQEIAAAEHELTAAKLTLDQAEEAFHLRAPFPGTVVEINIHTGEVIGPLQPALVMADLTNFQVVTTDLSEVDVAQLREGQSASIVFDAIPDRTFEGTIERIADKSSGVSSVFYEVTLSLDDVPDQLRWGMTAFIIFPIE